MMALKKILDGDDAPELNSADLKGSGILEPMDLKNFPPDVQLPHIDTWLSLFDGVGTEEKVGQFLKWWEWCTDEEKRQVMAGLSR